MRCPRAKINAKGKPKWAATINKLSVRISHQITNEEIDLDQLEKETTLKEDIIKRFEPADEFITCGVCHKESKISRIEFLLETLDATTKCSGCSKNLPVKNWVCLCNKPWHECEKHCRAGEVFRRLNAKNAKLKREDVELGRDPKRMQKQFKRELNALQTGVEISTSSRDASLTMRPKYNSVLSVGVNPNFLSRISREDLGGSFSMPRRELP